MGWLLGVYYALTRRGIIHLYLAETAIVVGHIFSIFLFLGPFYYFYRGLTVPSLLVAVIMLLYTAFRLLRRGTHRYFGLKLCLRKIFALGFLFPLLHAGSLPLLSIFCLTQSLSLAFNDLTTLVAAHLFGVALAIFALSTTTYMMGIGFLRKIWINFEKIWLAVLVSTAISLIATTLQSA